MNNFKEYQQYESNAFVILAGLSGILFICLYINKLYHKTKNDLNEDHELPTYEDAILENQQLNTSSWNKF